MLVFPANGDPAFTTPSTVNREWDGPGNLYSTVAPHSKYVETIPLAMPPYKGSGLWIFCDGGAGGAGLPRGVPVNAEASLVLGGQVNGGQLRGTIVVAFLEQGTDE